ncbi:MAG: Gldg family protein [Eubacteriales bacterium]|jgi:ABC-2 type transport system permease protein
MNMNGNNPEKAKKQGKGLSKSTKIGTYTFLVSLALLVILVIINLIVASLPSSLTVFDTTPQGLYTISESTQDFLGKISEPVTIHWICPDGTTDPTLETFLERYTSHSKYLKYDILDPIADPDCLEPYIGVTDAQPSQYSLIIESGRRHRLIDYHELFYYYNEYLAEKAGMTSPVPYEVYMYYNSVPYFYFSQAEQMGYPTETYFYGDDTITKAVEYVIRERIPHIYITEGHGEAVFSEMFLQYLADNNIEHEYLRTVTTESIPDDASCLVIYAPTSDLSESEAGMISAYLAGGGNMLLITSPDNTGMENLLSLVEPYGVSAVPGVVYDETPQNYKHNKYYLLPNIGNHSSISLFNTSYSIFMPTSHGIKLTENEAGAKITELFTTSSSAYSKVGEEQSEPGSLALGVAIEKGDAQIIWLSSALAFTDAAAREVSYGNYYYVLNMLTWMETYESTLSDVVGIPISEPLLDKLSQSSIYLWTVVFVIIIPLGVTAAGLTVWLRRRRR